MSRVLFVTSVALGGALESSRLLADAVAERGHAVSLVHARRDSNLLNRFHTRAVNLSTKLDSWHGGEPVWWITERLRGRDLHSETAAGLDIIAARIPENTAMARIDGADVVTGFSISRPAWRRVLRRCRQTATPTVLYLREDESLKHLDRTDAADTVVANAEIHATRARQRGYEAVTIPSIIDRSRARTATTRQCALLINPVTTYGVDIVVSLARAMPQVPFVLQESWPLDAASEQRLADACARNPNLELRRFTSDIASIYRDARILLVPYSDDNRPRVVAEAQANGIPVVGFDRPGIAEVTGDGGMLVPVGAALGEWVGPIESLWSDAALYDDLCERAQANSARGEREEARLVEEFVGVLTALTGRADSDRNSPSIVENE